MTSLKLVVAESRSELRLSWEKPSINASVEVRDCNIAALLQCQEIDCVVMPSWVHERLGGSPSVGKSMVLSNSQGIVGRVRWVATTPTFPASAKDAEAMQVPQWPTTAREQGVETFKRVLTAIRLHNQEPGADQIRIVGIDPEFLEFNADYNGEVTGVLMALSEVG
jgi:hypothetical protein